MPIILYIVIQHRKKCSYLAEELNSKNWLFWFQIYFGTKYYMSRNLYHNTSVITCGVLETWTSIKSSPSNHRRTRQILETIEISKEGRKILWLVAVRSQLVFVKSRFDTDLQFEGEVSGKQLLCGENSRHLRVVQGVIGDVAKLDKEKQPSSQSEPILDWD